MSPGVGIQVRVSEGSRIRVTPMTKLISLLALFVVVSVGCLNPSAPTPTSSSSSESAAQPAPVVAQPSVTPSAAQAAPVAQAIVTEPVVAVHEVGRDDGTLYIVSELIQGVTLADRLTQGPFTPREAAETCAQIADALQAAHQRDEREVGEAGLGEILWNDEGLDNHLVTNRLTAAETSGRHAEAEGSDQQGLLHCATVLSDGAREGADVSVRRRPHDVQCCARAFAPKKGCRQRGQRKASR